MSFRDEERDAEYRLDRETDAMLLSEEICECEWICECVEEDE